MPAVRFAAGHASEQEPDPLDSVGFVKGKLVPFLLACGAFVTTEGLCRYGPRLMDPPNPSRPYAVSPAIGKQAEAFAKSDKVAFSYYRRSWNGTAVPIQPDAELTARQQQVTERIADVLQNRPDLMTLLTDLPNGLEIALVQGSNIAPFPESLLGVYGGEVRPRNFPSLYTGDKKRDIYLVLSTEQIDTSLKHPGDGMEVVGHELTHVLELVGRFGKAVGERTADEVKTYINSLESGYLPGWTEAERVRFAQAREAEKKRITWSSSLLREYGNNNNMEFLATLVENYLERPRMLKASSPVLYEMMDQYFRRPADPNQAEFRQWNPLPLPEDLVDMLRMMLTGAVSLGTLYGAQKWACRQKQAPGKPADSPA